MKTTQKPSGNGPVQPATTINRRAYAQELLLSAAFKDYYPLTSLPLPLSSIDIELMQMDLDNIAYKHSTVPGRFLPLPPPFTAQEVKRLVFLKLNRGMRFG